MKKIVIACMAVFAAFVSSAQTITFDAAVLTDNRISDKLMGFNIVYAKTPDSVWENDVLVDGIRAVNPGFLRYPGGTVNTYFHFEHPTGQGWKDNWNPDYDDSINADPSQYTDIDEYFGIIERTGAEPLVGINTNSAFVYDRLEDGIAEALRLMQYCRDKGYKVKYWYLGNEPYARDGNGGRVGPTLYAKMINAFAPRMKEFDPDIKIIANLKSDIPGDKANWDEFLSLAGKNIDMMDIHWYNMWGHATWDEWLKRTPQGNRKGTSYEEEILNFRAICKEHGLPELPLCTLEWNVGPGRKDNGSVLTVGQSALAQSEMMLQFMRGGVYMATFWPLFWDGNFCTRGFYEKKTGQLNPIADVLKSMSSFQGLAIIGTSGSTMENTITLAAADTRTGLTRVAVLNKNGVPVSLSLKALLPEKCKKVNVETYRISEDLQVLEHSEESGSGTRGLCAVPYSLTIISFVNPEYAVPAPEGWRNVFGNTHAHCNFSGDIEISRKKKGLGLDPRNSADSHFRIARENGYDFYFVTDHSQYPCYTPEAWKFIGSCAEVFTDDTFVGMRGYEHSENNGPDGKGHMNVFGSETYLNAMADSVSIEYFHNWLADVVNPEAFAGFNHPQKDAYNDFHCYNETVRGKFRVIELVNGKNPKYYPSFLNALSKGWKVSPVAGCDNHGWEGIPKWPCRTGLLVKELTPEGILDAMRSRRTYATFDKNLSARYTVNGAIMGSDIRKAGKYVFDIELSDPDKEPDITRVEIVGKDGNVLKSKDFASNNVSWSVTLRADDPYFFVLVYTSEYQDHPTAYLAPVWVN